MASLALLMRFVPLEREWMTKSYVRAGISPDRLNAVKLASILIRIGSHTTSTHAVFGLNPRVTDKSAMLLL